MDKLQILTYILIGIEVIGTIVITSALCEVIMLKRKMNKSDKNVKIV